MIEDISESLKKMQELIDLLIEKEKKRLEKIKEEMPELVRLAQKMAEYKKNGK